ncbi:hypothetical protein NDU88_002167 [Pleurodeles waltl]|uniref:Uncharacterized protein n=1 Tax=Pleurodeles waltl TaxID=8319 RepID=A0AAV7Q6C5_PLEWA|nr:hypothetical protein NDU88_002167 [Pleurodeles waltl]
MWLFKHSSVSRSSCDSRKTLSSAVRKSPTTADRHNLGRPINLGDCSMVDVVADKVEVPYNTPLITQVLPLVWPLDGPGLSSVE